MDFYGNDDLLVSNVVIFYYFVSNFVVWKVLGDVGTPLKYNLKDIFKMNKNSISGI